MKQFILFTATLFFASIILAQNAETPLDTTSLNSRIRNPHFGYNGYSNQNSTQNHYPYYSEHNNEIFSPISNYLFFTELKKVRIQTSIFGKKMAAKRLANAYILSANQVSQLCRIFNGYNQLEIAKYCYSRCYDPFNYDVVMNNMEMGIANELSEYISYVDANENDIDNWHPIYTGNYNYHMPMSNQNFNAAKQTIENTSFDNTKLETAKSIVAANYVTTDQVSEICRMFSFEASKLDFAKFAYRQTIDKNNYFKVSNVFDFDSSKSSLTKFIQQNQ